MTEKNHTPGKPRRTNTIFVVDHDQDNLSRFRELFNQYKNLVYYSTSPDEIASVMEGVSPDLVIGSLGMRGHTAEDFFRYIKNKSPHAIRVIYSHETEKNELMRLLAVGTVHRFFCLPWQKNKIDQLLAQDLGTRAKLRTRKVCDFLEREDRIPILPQVVTEIDRILQNEDYTIDDLIAVIEKDPVITSKLLQIVNSAAFPKKSTISALFHAITYLGIKQVRELVLFICAREVFPPSKQCREAASIVADMSFKCSKLASRIAEIICPGLEKETATAALLHDIGKMVFYSPSFCENYILRMSNKNGDYDPVSLIAEEDEEPFGINHTEVGSCLLLWWNMPIALIETAANHRLPLEELTGITKCVAIAYKLLLQAGDQDLYIPDLENLDDEYPIEQWQQAAKEILTN